ncbi:MAG: response regulator [Candidatus Omnitrophica bacterium]|nr:response regulator [Candidatus Omnitrophota bacterium]
MKKKVLVIDDEVDLLKIIKLNLEGTESYEVSTLSSARDIVSRVRIFKPDVILLDILMPGFDGIEACEILNKDPVGARIPIIILSALRGDVDRLKAFKAGVLDYLAKPVKTEELISKIEKHTQFMR